LNNNAPSTPPSACGGYVDVTWTYTSASACAPVTCGLQTNYGSTTCTKRFTVTAAPAVTFNCGSNVTVPSCSTQAQVNTAWASFLASTTVSGGCSTGVLTNNAPSTPPSSCGGYVDVTWTYTSASACAPVTCGGQTNYGTTTCTKRFTVTGGGLVDVTGPCNVMYTNCSFSNQAALNCAFATWLAQFQTLSSGCGATVSCGSSTGGAVAVFSGDPRVAPSLLNGGVVRVTYSIAGSCNQDTVCATFAVNHVSNCGGCTAKTAPEEVAVSSVPMDVKVYPNPFIDTFSLNLTTSSVDKVSLSIYDMAGKLIENKEMLPTAVSDLQLGDRYPSGVYNIIVSQGTQVKTLRVIKR
jgi:hypothetical protein